MNKCTSPPLVSVLLPVRNGAQTLAAAVASLSAQTFKNFEIIAINDGSSDNSAQVLARLAHFEPRLRIEQQSARGLVASLNNSIALSRGSWIARMDCDDLSYPERLEAQLAFLNVHRDIDVVGTLVEAGSVDGRGVGRGMARYIEWSNGLVTPAEIARARFIESPLVHPTVMMRRDFIERHGGYKDGDEPEDYELWLRLIAAGARLAKVARPLLIWRDHPRRATRTEGRYAPERLRELKIRFLLEGPLVRERPFILWGAGLEGKAVLRALRAMGKSACAIVEVDGRKIGNTIHGAPVVAPTQLGDRLLAHPAALVLVAVGVPRARPEIRAACASLGVIEGDRLFFLC